MSLLTAVPDLPADALRSRWTIYRKETLYELLKTLRMPAFAIPSILFPVAFYLFFGVGFGGRQQFGGVSMATFLLATYGAFGVIGASLFGFGVGVAMERGQGWLLLKRASPMPPGAYFAAKIVMSLVFSAIILTLLFTLGALLGNVAMPWSSWLQLAAILLAGVFPFAAFGLAMGYFCGPNSAPAVVNLIYLPMAFCSGLWIPIQVLPELVQRIALYLPAYHYSQLALKVLGADAGRPVVGHLAYLVGFTVLCLGVAVAGFRRDASKSYG
jgi:ABC-2 type transport system permease protein